MYLYNFVWNLNYIYKHDTKLFYGSKTLKSKSEIFKSQKTIAGKESDKFGVFLIFSNFERLLKKFNHLMQLSNYWVLPQFLLLSFKKSININIKTNNVVVLILSFLW